MSLAVATINGRLTRDPEVREFDNGGSVTNFSLACDQYNGPNKDKTSQFWDIECWTPAQKVLSYLKKGDPITVSGELRQEEGNKEPKRRFYKLRVLQVGTLPPRGSSDGERIRAESGVEEEDPF